MKYHKIRNVPLDVCTLEQMTAYNLACSYSDIVIAGAKSGKFHSFVEASQYICTKLYTAKKCDVDAVYCALNAGLERYIMAKSPIMKSYAEIGEMFPAHYLGRV